MARSPDRAVRVVTLALMAVAYAACEVAAYPDGNPRPVGVGFGVVVLALAVLAAVTLKPVAADARPSRRLSLPLGLVLVLPLLAEPLVRSAFGEGFPLEMQLVNGLRILGLSLAGLSAWPKLRRLAGVVALFLALFSSAMGDQPAIPYLLAAFALTGGLWLVLEHLTAGRADAAADSELRERVPLRLPYREAVVFGVLAATAAAVAAAGPKRVMLTLGELVPTSGGTGNTDPFARYGVGDGPEETAGDNAKAAGMVETDKMIEDNKDALIDAVNDMYGPPHKPRTDGERLVAAGKMDIIQNHGKLPDNRRPSRDFDTGRKGPKSDRKPGSQGTRGVFEVEGRTPLHVRSVAYETYNPESGRWREGRQPNNRTFEAEGGDWMAVGNLRDGDWYAGDDRHRLKVADLKDNLVPTPAHLTRFRINKVDRPDYYQWDYEGVLALAGRKRTPPGVVVTTDCRTIDPRRLDATVFVPTAPGGGALPHLGDVPAGDRAGLGRLAAAWAGDRPRGWPQIDAVLTRLRTDYTLDPQTTAPADHPAPVMWFLAESRRGPDYQFATAAALLLRSLGYPARVCLGYYAAPAAYDPETGHTPVKKTDLHVWPEVLLRDGHWLVVEPTPGYEVLPPLQSWGEWAADRLAALAAFTSRNAVPLAGLAVVAGLLVWRRRRVWDAVLTLRWAAFPGRTWRDAALRAAAVLDRRGALAGRGRRPTQSLTDWAGGLPADDALGRLVGLAEQAAYAPALPPPVAEADVLPLCRRAVRAWSFRRFVSAPPGGSA
jgi:transglutaminase-like putative cysteine protease